MGATVGVRDTVGGARTHAGGTEVVHRREGRSAVHRQGADGAVEQFGLLVRVPPHGVIVGVLIHVHVRDGHAMGIRYRTVQGHPVTGAGHIFTHDPQPGQVVVAVEQPGEVPAPGAGVGERRQERRAQGQGLQVVPAHETTLRVMPGLVGDDPGHGLTAVEVHRTVEPGENRTGGVPHVVPAQLPRRVGQPIGKLRAGTEQ